MATADDINLENMSRSDLEQLRKDVDKAISNYDERQRKKAMVEVERVAAEHGISVAELMGNKKAKKGSKTPPKFAHPENPELTWSGKGRKPKWFQEHLDNGGKEEDLLIK